MSNAARPDWGVTACRYDVPAGGGAFALSNLTIGLFLVAQDEHRLALGSDRRHHIPLSADDGWILPAGAAGICEFDDAHSYLTVSFDKHMLDDVGLDTSTAFRPHVGGLEPLLAQLVRLAADRGEDSSSLYRQTMDLALATHLARLLAPHAELCASLDDRRLRKVIAYVQEHLNDDISLDQLASEAAMSRYHFARAFKAATGRSPIQYVIDERLDRARLLFKTTSATVAEVAFRVGYADVSRFGQHFRKRVGITPAQFRSQ
ncbi:AraC family transcriptional regulator [Rhizobium croatiense]|uniref:AraC family transcriptional regulator n=1 Tax=Rhizobium croatiense TaxID=2867516 RepID=UPI001FEA5445|nr:AraC family transcriptional regulator [Rhizobium croatiense]